MAAKTFDDFIAPIKDDPFAELIIPTAYLAWQAATEANESDAIALLEELIVAYKDVPMKDIPGAVFKCIDKWRLMQS